MSRLDLGTTWRPTSEDAETFVRDSVAAWAKVMDLDRFDLA